MEEFLNKEYTVRDLNDVASKLLGRKINISGKVDDVVNGSAIFGPKIGGGFFQNLRGNFNGGTSHDAVFLRDALGFAKRKFLGL